MDAVHIPWPFIPVYRVYEHEWDYTQYELHAAAASLCHKILAQCLTVDSSWGWLIGGQLLQLSGRYILLSYHGYVRQTKVDALPIINQSITKCDNWNSEEILRKLINLPQCTNIKYSILLWNLFDFFPHKKWWGTKCVVLGKEELYIVVSRDISFYKINSWMIGIMIF